MQNLVNDTPGTRNYNFIDSIRCLAMMSVVMEHCLSFNDKQYHPNDQLSIFTYIAVIQFIKFGTIAFFLLAGFLIGEKFTTYTPLQYLKKRVDNTILPWVFWSLLFLGTFMLNDVISYYKFHLAHFEPDYGNVILKYIRNIYLFTSYWFIPNFLICIAILLIFKRYLYSYWLGASLFLFNIWYIFNIYYEWVEPRHSTAILGFVFFLWLGAQLNKHLGKLQAWVKNIPAGVLAILVLITLLLAVCEVFYLKKHGSADAFNTLRLSNILYSLCFFFLLLKIKDFKFVNFLKPRETTYGIYLIHYILVIMVLPLIFPGLRFGINQLSYGMAWLYMLSRFVIVYGLSYLLVRLINNSRLKWMTGR